MISVSRLFQNQDLLITALTHRSYCNEHPKTESNERLEFLGDAVLSLIISKRLYVLFPHLPEGDLTGRRSYFVQTTTLASKAISLGLDQALRLSRGEQDLGGRSNPSLLADTFEAVLGALYLDSGLAACEDYLDTVFPNSEIVADYQIKDPKSLLQEKSQAAGLGTPAYHLVSTSGPDHAKSFTVEVTLNHQSSAQGSGASKQKAETEAARAAISKLFPDSQSAKIDTTL